MGLSENQPMPGQPRWRGFERLAERIAREFVGHRAEVEWDAHIPGEQSGIVRQIDLAVRWVDPSGSPCLTVIDCKDWKRPADVNDVGKFAAVVQDVKATQGILVCNAGFAASVRDYARNLGLSLMNLHDAESANWSRNITIPLVWTDLLPHVRLHIEGRFEAGDTGDLDGRTMIRSADSHIQGRLMDLFTRPWNAGALPRGDGVYRVEDPVEMAMLDGSGQVVWRPLSELHFDYRVERTTRLGQFTPEQCRGFIDHLDQQAFYATHLPLSQLPACAGPRVDRDRAP